MSDFTVKVWPKGEPIDLRDRKIVTQLMPTELHVKPDGDIHDQPSLCFVLKNGSDENFIAQISERMLREGLQKCEQARFLLNG